MKIVPAITNALIVYIKYIHLFIYLFSSFVSVSLVY